jgi:GT2 family glycosyltransferase
VIDLTTDGHAVASIVTVSYGQRPLLARMLGSLAATTARNVEVVLVDNASPDDTLTWLDQNTSGVRLVDAGRNLGLLAASAPIVVFVNTDVVFAGRWLEPLLEAVQTTGAAAPLSLDGEGNIVEAGGVIDGDGHAHVLTGAGSPDRRVVAHASAACLAVARRDLIVVGGFDPAFGMGYHWNRSHARPECSGRAHRGRLVRFRASWTPRGPQPCPVETPVAMVASRYLFPWRSLGGR